MKYYTFHIVFSVRIKKNSGVVVVQDRIITWHAKISTDGLQYIFEEILLDLHHHIARLAWLIQ